MVSIIATFLQSICLAFRSYPLRAYRNRLVDSLAGSGREPTYFLVVMRNKIGSNIRRVEGKAAMAKKSRRQSCYG